jgi:hypothetical protein
MYVGGAQVFTYSGNLLTDSATALAQLELGDGTNAYNGNYFDWSEIIVSDSDTRSMSIILLNASPSGTLTQWTGTAANVNTATINDANYIASGTPLQINEYKTAATWPVGAFTVLEVVQNVRASVSTTGPQHVDVGFNFNGTRYWSADWAPPLTSFGNSPQTIWTTNPNTGVAWTQADLQAATFNYGVRSNT